MGMRQKRTCFCAGAGVKGVDIERHSPLHLAVFRGHELLPTTKSVTVVLLST